MTGKPVNTAQPDDFIGIIHADRSFRMFKVDSVSKGMPLLAWINDTARQLVCELELKGEMFALTQDKACLERLWSRGKRDYGAYWSFTCAVGRAKVAVKYDGQVPMSKALYDDDPTVDAPNVQPEPQNAPAAAPAQPEGALNDAERAVLSAWRNAAGEDEQIARRLAKYELYSMLGDNPHEAFVKAYEAGNKSA